jgi:DNA polymerase V|tara:strand:- start:428 stop:937 length:510 start_codon:yes stop_codon:yes gene_type:complete
MFTSANHPRIFIPKAGRRLALPLVAARVPAGFPSPAEDFSDGTLDLNDLIEHPAATFIVKVSGSSMTGAGIFDGDLLIVDRSITPRSGQIVVAVLAGDMTVKRLRRRDGRWWLIPEVQGTTDGGSRHQDDGNAVGCRAHDMLPDGFAAVEMGEDSEIWGVVKNVVRCLS